MALNLATLRDKIAHLSFEFEGETVSIQYRPHKLTPEYMASIRRISQSDDGEGEQDGANYDAQVVSDVLVSWDVMAGDEPFPPTYENLLLVPQALVSRVAVEILSDVGKLAMPKPSKR